MGCPQMKFEIYLRYDYLYLNDVNLFLKFQDELNLPCSKEDFMDAIKKVNRSVSDDDLEKHQKWSSEFGSV